MDVKAYLKQANTSSYNSYEKCSIFLYYKFLRTHHPRGARYHFGTGIPFVSKIQCTIRRVNSKRPGMCQSDSVRRSRDVCEGICNTERYYIFRIIANMGFCFLVMTEQILRMSPQGQNASRDGLVKLWEAVLLFSVLLLCEITTSFV